MKADAYLCPVKKAYFISGLGADERVFKYIRVPEDWEVVHLTWIKPFPGESLPDYAWRLSERIDTSEPFSLVGLSFGGMLATEIAKKYHPRHTILISSVPVSKQLPAYFRAAATLNLHKIVPMGLVKFLARTKRFVSSEKPEDKKLLWQLINESDPVFLRWAMHAILQWKNEAVPSSLWHIHGTRDEILPVKFTQPTHFIPKAGHLAIMSNAEDINRLLQTVLND